MGKIAEKNCQKLVDHHTLIFKGLHVFYKNINFKTTQIGEKAKW